jgi:hypothetical protein
MIASSEMMVRDTASLFLTMGSQPGAGIVKNDEPEEERLRNYFSAKNRGETWITMNCLKKL